MMNRVNKNRKNLWTVFCLSFSVFFATFSYGDSLADPRNPPSGLFSDIWLAIMLEGQKIGYAHNQQLREGDQIRSETRTYMLMKRGGVPVEISVAERTLETIAGEPISFENEMNLAQQPMRMSGAIKNGQLSVVAEQYGVKNEQELPYPSGALMSWGIYLQTLQHKPVAGTRFSLSVFSPSQAIHQGLPMSLEVIGPEEIEWMGQRISAIKTRTVTTINGVNIEAMGWVNDQWEPLKQNMNMMGMNIEMVKVSKDQALADVTGAEMFVNTLIPAGRSIDRHQARSITFQITAAENLKLPDFPETQMQKVVEKKDNQVILKITRLDSADLATTQPAQVPTELAEYLKSTAFITSDDPQVVALAKQAAGDEKNPLKLADRLRRQVSQTVRYEGLGVAFASAAEVCRTGQGDCTENSVLLAALGRAMGIPSRVVTGLIYVENFSGQKDVFGFHMWTQFWIAGQWVDLDAAWDQTEVDPTHIALGTHSTEHATMGDLVSSVMLQLNRIKIAAVKIEE